MTATAAATIPAATSCSTPPVVESTTPKRKLVFEPSGAGQQQEQKPDAYTAPQKQSVGTDPCIREKLTTAVAKSQSTSIISPRSTKTPKASTDKQQVLFRRSQSFGLQNNSTLVGSLSTTHLT